MNKVLNLSDLSKEVGVNSAKMQVLISALRIPTYNHIDYSEKMYDYKVVQRYLLKHGFYCGDYSEKLKEIM